MCCCWLNLKMNDSVSCVKTQCCVFRLINKEQVHLHFRHFRSFVLFLLTYLKKETAVCISVHMMLVWPTWHMGDHVITSICVFVFILVCLLVCQQNMNHLCLYFTQRGEQYEFPFFFFYKHCISCFIYKCIYLFTYLILTKSKLCGKDNVIIWHQSWI